MIAIVSEMRKREAELRKKEALEVPVERMHENALVAAEGVLRCANLLEKEQPLEALSAPLERALFNYACDRREYAASLHNGKMALMPSRGEIMHEAGKVLEKKGGQGPGRISVRKNLDAAISTYKCTLDEKLNLVPEGISWSMK